MNWDLALYRVILFVPPGILFLIYLFVRSQRKKEKEKITDKCDPVVEEIKEKLESEKSATLILSSSIWIEE